MSPGLFIFTVSMDHLASELEEEERIKIDMSNFVSFAHPQYTKIEITPREISSLRGYENVKKETMTKKQAFLNIMIMSLISIMSGWLGFLLKNWTSNTELALLAFLAVPALGILFLSTFYNERKLELGLEPRFKENGFIYLAVFLIIPVLTMLVLFTGHLTGWITFTGFIEKGFRSYLSAAVVLLFSDLFKNCLEEFTWRGFFSRQLQVMGIPGLLNHLLTGMIWVLWHVPYWLFLFDWSLLDNYSAQEMVVFFFLTSLTLLASSVVYGEIRLLSRSIWPAVLLHASLDAVTVPLLLKGFVTVQPSASVWLSPVSNSFVFIILLCVTGLVFNRIRMRKTGTSR